MADRTGVKIGSSIVREEALISTINDNLEEGINDRKNNK